jgi:hypothetical protein
LPVTATFQIPDVLISKPDVPVFTSWFPMASFWGASIKAFTLPPLEGAGANHETYSFLSLCELSPTPHYEV